MQNQKVSVLIIGANGTLGSKITKHALANDRLEVSILVRDLEKSKELVKEVESQGGKVFKGDIADANSIQGITKGIHTIISALSSFDEATVVKGQ